MNRVKNAFNAVSFRNNSHDKLWQTPSGFHLFQWFWARICSRAVSLPWHPWVEEGEEQGQGCPLGKEGWGWAGGSCPCPEMLPKQITQILKDKLRLLLSSSVTPVLMSCWGLSPNHDLGSAPIPHPTKHSICQEKSPWSWTPHIKKNLPPMKMYQLLHLIPQINHFNSNNTSSLKI